MLIYSFYRLLDANTRQDATEKLDNASRENYVRLLFLHPQHLLWLIITENVARIHADAFIGSCQ